MTLLEKLDRLTNEIYDFYQKDIKDEKDWYVTNRQLKRQFKPLIIAAKGEHPCIMRAVLRRFASLTGCADEQGIANEIMSSLHVQGDLRRVDNVYFNKYLSTNRWH